MLGLQKILNELKDNPFCQ